MSDTALDVIRKSLNKEVYAKVLEKAKAREGRFVVSQKRIETA